MIAIGRENIASPIYLPNPVNRDHPLNHNRFLWLLGIPQITGGNKFYDLMNRNHAAFSANGPLWISRPDKTDEFGALKFNGTNQIASMPVDLTGVSKITVAFDLWQNAFANDAHQALAHNIGDTSGGEGFWVQPGTATNVEFRVYRPNIAHVVGITRPSAAAWHRYAFTVDYTLATSQINAVFLDGVSQSLTVSLNTLTAGTFGNHTFYLMYYWNLNIFNAGRLGDISIWTNRLLTAAEIKEEYNLSRLGYPGVLNRIEPAYLGSAARAIQGLLLRRRRILAQC